MSSGIQPAQSPELRSAGERCRESAVRIPHQDPISVEFAIARPGDISHSCASVLSVLAGADHQACRSPSSILGSFVAGNDSPRFVELNTVFRF
jgi:hypothetical protein